MRIVFFDLETGGLDPNRHPIIQVAALAIDNDTFQEVDQFEAKLRFDLNRADTAALEANSYDANTWENEAIDSQDALSRFSDFLREYADVELTSRKGRPYFVAQLAGHNAAAFDGPFLRDWFKRSDEFLPAAYSVLCTLQRALWYFQENPQIEKPANLKLGTLAEHFGIEHDNAHDALADVRATVELYKALINKR